MKIKFLISAVALVALAGGVVHAGGGSSAGNEVFYALTAFSQDELTDSSVSRSSFGNALTPYDALREPWQYPHLDANRSRRLGYTPRGNGIQNQLVWTQLGNVSADDTFGVAYLGKPCKSGYLGAQLTFTTSSYDYMGVDTFPGFVSTDTDSESQTMFSGYVGYGWAPSEKISHGVGISLFGGQDEYNSRFLDSGFGGSLFEDEVEEDDLRVTYGVRFTPSDDFSWTLEGTYGTGSIESFIRSTSLDAMGVPTSSSTFGSVDMDNETLGVAGRLNWYKGESRDYQIRWGYSQTSNDMTNGAFDFLDIGGMITPFQNVLSNDIGSDTWGVGGKVGHHDGALHIYGGLDIQSTSIDIDVVSDFNAPMVYQFGENYQQSYMNYVPNVAFIYEFTEHVALVGGAEYNYYSDEYELLETDYDVVTPANNSSYYQEQELSFNESAIRAGVELRYKKLIVDIGLSHSENDGIESLDSSDLYFSARFGF